MVLRGVHSLLGLVCTAAIIMIIIISSVLQDYRSSFLVICERPLREAVSLRADTREPDLSGRLTKSEANSAIESLSIEQINISKVISGSAVDVSRRRERG